MKFAHGKNCKYAARSWFTHAGVSLQWQNESMRQRSQQIHRFVLRAIALFESWIVWIHSWLETRDSICSSLVSQESSYLWAVLYAMVVITNHTHGPCVWLSLVWLPKQDTMMPCGWHDWRRKASNGGATSIGTPDQISEHTLPAKGFIRSYTRLRIQPCRAWRQSWQPGRIQTDIPGHFLLGPDRPSTCWRQDRYDLPRDLNG